jgi:CheY-like chemotaxis protein
MKNTYPVLIVDDEDLVHDVLAINLRDMEYAGKKIHLHHAHQAQEAQNILASYPDIVLIILDVMMEEDDAGLNLVRFIREEMKNQDVRIVLHTGQPGIAPKKEVSSTYEIDGYLDKNSMDNEDCYVAVKLALRAYEDRMNLKKEARQDDVSLLKKIAAIYIELFSNPSLFKEYEAMLKKMTQMVYLSQEILAAYALNDLKKNLSQGTTKAERLSYKNYVALTQIYDIKIILMQTTPEDYQIEHRGITHTVLAIAKQFSTIPILPDNAKKKLLGSIQYYEEAISSKILV